MKEEATWIGRSDVRKYRNWQNLSSAVIIWLRKSDKTILELAPTYIVLGPHSIILYPLQRARVLTKAKLRLQVHHFLKKTMYLRCARGVNTLLVVPQKVPNFVKSLSSKQHFPTKTINPSGLGYVQVYRIL
jgi:hypothetical protein